VVAVKNPQPYFYSSASPPITVPKSFYLLPGIYLVTASITKKTEQQ
jgi:hypothetical protein